MAGTTNRFKRNAEAGGVEPKPSKVEVPAENKVEETIEEQTQETVAGNTADAVTETTAAPDTATSMNPVPASVEPISKTDANMTVALNGMIDFGHRFVKREAKSKQVPLNITPTVNEQLQFLVENNMIKSRNDFIFQLVETALASIFSNQEVLDEFNRTRNKWEK